METQHALMSNDVRVRGLVIVVDDDEPTCHLLADCVRLLGFDVEIATSAMQALAMMRERPFNVAFCDIVMPGYDGVWLINRIRRENPALQSDANLLFHDTDNAAVICYSKATSDLSDIVIVLCNLDPFHKHTGWIDLDLASLGLDARRAFQAHDLLSDGRFLWRGARNYFELTPESLPAHIMKVRKLVRTERDFDYYF